MKPWEEYQNAKMPWEEYQNIYEPRTRGQRALDSLKHDAEDVLYGVRRGLSGATLGASEWALRKMGVGDDYMKRRETEGLGGAAKIGGLTAEIGGNVLGAGGAITKGLSKMGFSDTGLLLRDSGLQGMLYGLTSSDKLDDAPINTVLGGIGGVALGMGMQAGFKVLGNAVNYLRSDVQRGITYMRQKLGDAATNAFIKKARDEGRTLAEVVNDEALDIAQAARQQTPKARYTMSENIQNIRDTEGDKNRQFIDDMLGSKSGYDTVQDIAQAEYEKAKPIYEGLRGKDLAEYDAVARPTIEQLSEYSAESKFNPNNYTKEQAIKKLRERAKQMGTSIYNDELTGYGKRLGANHFIQNKDIPNVRTINNTVNNPDISYKQKVDGKWHDYYFKKYDTLKHSFSDTELQNAFEKGNFFPELNDKLSKAEKFDIFKKFAKEYEKHLGEYKEGTLYGQKDLPKDFYNSLTEKQRNVMDDNSYMFMDLLDYFDNRVSDKDLTELLDFDILQDGKFFNKFKTTVNYLSNQINKPVKDLSFNRRVSVQEPISGGQDITSNNNISSISSFVKENPYIQNEISNVRKDLTLPESVRNASDTNFDILDAVKKNIDDKIGVAQRGGENELARRLTGIKNDLIEYMDAIAPIYKQARSIYRDAKQFESAYDAAADVFKTSVKTPQFRASYDKMTDAEKESLRLGLKDELYKIIGNRENETMGWKRVVPAEVQNKIKMVLGVKEGEKLIAKANSEIRKMRNFNKLLSGSQTSEKQGLRDAYGLAIEATSHPTGAIGSVLKRVPWNDGRNIGIAKIMTDPRINLEAAFEESLHPTGKVNILYDFLNSSKKTPYQSALAAYLAGTSLK